MESSQQKGRLFELDVKVLFIKSFSLWRSSIFFCKSYNSILKDKNFEELLYVLRISSSDLEDDIKKEFMLIFMKGDHKYTIENMKKYNISEKFISEKFRGCKNPMVDNIDDDDDDDDEYIKMVQG